MYLYNFKVFSNDGKEVSLSEYKGKVLLIVNTASNCGFTPQYKGLQDLYEKYGNEKFEILAFPSNQFGEEPEDNEYIAAFCKENFGVTFPLFKKIDVNGPDAEPLYKYLKNQKLSLFNNDIKWNFTKFLVNHEGKVIKRFASKTTPEEIDCKIKKLIDLV